MYFSNNICSLSQAAMKMKEPNCLIHDSMRYVVHRQGHLFLILKKCTFFAAFTVESSQSLILLMSSCLKSKMTLVFKTLSLLDIVMKKTTSKQVYYGLMGWFESQKKEIPLWRANKVVFFGIEAHKPRSKCPGPCCLYCCWCTSGISVTCSNKLSMVKNLHLETKINLIWCQGPEH